MALFWGVAKPSEVVEVEEVVLACTVEPFLLEMQFLLLHLPAVGFEDDDWMKAFDLLSCGWTVN